MRPGAGDEREGCDAQRVREVQDGRGYPFMRSGNATFVAATPLLPPCLHLSPTVCCPLIQTAAGGVLAECCPLQGAGGHSGAVLCSVCVLETF